MSLQDWQKNGWLEKYEANAQEILNLLDLVDRDLRECQVPGLSTDWRLNIAYNAALQAATAALAASGFRASRENKHYRVIQSLAYTIKADSNIIVELDQFRKKRNIDSYQVSGSVSMLEAKEMFFLANELRLKVEEWLRFEYPELLQK